VTGTSASERRAGASERHAVGIFGGTFNPPHLGHLAVARHALEELALTRVLLMPAYLSPHKQTEEGPGAEHRLRMCELAVAGVEGVAVSALEIERGGPSYTVDTLKAIHASDPDAELTFIVGADTALTLASWRQPQELLELARLAVAARAGSPREHVLETVAAIARQSGGSGQDPVAAVEFLEMGPIEVSSSMVRERLAGGEPVDGLLAPAVADYIEQRGLYRTGAGVPG
jgi:nicotinate-nucleotide adenylyltransferase